MAMPLARWIGGMVSALAGMVLVALMASVPAAAARAPDAITVAIGTDFPPHSALDDSGRLQGMRPDLWALWSRATGIAVHFVAVPWSKAIELVERGDADVADPVVYSAARASRFLLSPPFIHITVHAFFDAGLNNISDVSSLRGLPVAASGQGACKDWLAGHGATDIRTYPNLEAMVRATIDHETKVFCTGRETALYYLAKLGATDRFRYTAPLYIAPFHWAVHKQRQDLFELVQAGFDRIPAADYQTVEQRWLGSPEREAVSRDKIMALSAISALAATLLVMMATWNRMLRRRVAAAVAEHRTVVGHLDATLSNLPGVVYRQRVAPTERAFTYLSPTFERQCGLSIARFRGMAPAEQLALVHPADQAQLVGRWKDLTVEGVTSGRFRFIRPDGRIRWFEFRERITDRVGDELHTEGLVLDVTEEEDARRALAERERLWAAVVGATTVGVVVIDCETLRFVDFNDAACADLGYSRAEFARLTLADVAESRERIHEDRRLIHENGNAVLNTRHRHRDGSSRDTHVTTRLTEFRGRPCYAAVWTDITDLKRMERSLRDTAGHLETLLANLPGVVYRMRLTPTDGELTYLSETFERQYGLSVGRFKHMTLAERLGMIHPEDRAAHAERWRTLASDGELVARARFLRPDGQVRWFEYHERVVDRDGDHLVAEGLVLDVTAEEEARLSLEKTSEQQRILAAIVDALPDLAWAMDRDGRYLAVNAALAGHVNAAKAAGPDGDPTGAQAKAVLAACALRHRDVLTGAGGEIREELPAGAGEVERWLDVRRAPLRDAGGAVIGSVGIARDITARKQLEHELRETALDRNMLLTNLPSAIVRGVYHDDGRFAMTYVSDGITAMTGYTPEEWIAITRAEPMGLGGIHPDDIPSLAERRKAAGDDENSSTVRLIRKDGSLLWVILRARIVRQPDGEAVVVGMVIDISERKAVENRLALFERAVNASSDAILLVDQALNISYANDAACRSLGYSRDELQAMSPLDFDTDLSREAAQAIADDTWAGKPLHFHSHNRHRDGRVFPVEVSNTLVEHDGAAYILSVVRDITERKRLEHDLRDTAERLRALLENIPGAVYCGVEGERGLRLTFVSDGIATMTGYTPEEWMAESLGANLNIHPDDHAIIASGTEARRRTGRFEATVRMRRKDGSPFWGMLRSRTTLREDGSSGIAGLLLDVSSEMEARRALEEERRRFEDMVSALPVAVFEDRPEIGSTYVNQRWLDFVGLGRDEVLGADWLRGIHPDDRSRVRRACAAGRARREVIRGEFRLMTPDGKVTWVDGYAVPRFTADGDFLGYVGTASDITRLREMEHELREHGQRFEALVDNLPGGVMRAALGYDGAFRIIYLSRGMDRLSGLKAGEGMALTPDQQLAMVHPDDRALFPEGFERLLRDGKNRTRLRVARRDGSWIWQDVWSTVVERRADGVVYESLILDVTEEMQAKRALEAEEAERRRLEAQVHENRKLEALGQLAGGIAHDFNNLLGAILGFGQFIVEDAATDAPAQRYAQRILSAAQRGKALVDQILAFARRSALEKSRLSLGALVRECTPLLQVAIPSSIRIETHLDQPPPEVDGDRGQLTQVLMNLCFNARDALETRTGTITITVTTLPPRHPLLLRVGALPATEAATALLTEDDGASLASAGVCAVDRPHAAISVADTGPGMEAALLSRIFDPFFTTKEPGKGTGLGLSVVHGIVINHGGAVVVRSGVGAGCEFTILLPLADAGAAHPHIAASDAAAVAPRNATAGGLALVVDDNEDFGDMMAECLERLGWTVVHHASANAAIDDFSADPAAWSLLITDQVMPDLRGDEIIARVRDLRPDLPTILCTGYDGYVDDDRAADLRIDAVLHKPVEMDALTAAVAKVALELV
jgi:PAS domain S-box-containing protein